MVAIVTVVALGCPILPTSVLLALIVLLFGAQIRQLRSLRLAAMRNIPVLLFAGTAYVLRGYAAAWDMWFLLRILFIYLGTLMGARLCLQGATPIPRNRLLFRFFLFLHFLRHFAQILLGETERLLIARKVAAPRLYSNGGFRSLSFALASILQRSLTRAENFYAAQCLKGLDA